ncbi:MAG TPA: sigma 54-interacting transcriptional regulator [Flavobacteriaceae bacterium]|nr:sigma 54-interacting transcriptional regulator [Flavobacteriaceae bacterium]
MNKLEFENIVNSIGDPVFVKDNQSRLLIVNDAFCEIFNLPKELIIGKTLAEDVPEKEREFFLKIDKKVLETGVEIVREETLTVREGETKTILTKKNRYIDNEGNKFLIGVIRDITDRKKAEIELKKAHHFSEGLITSMHEGLVVFNMKTEIISVNPSFCKMSGFSEQELIGKECPYPFSPPEIEEESNLRHEKLNKGEDVDEFDTIYMKKDGTRFNARVIISSINGTDGNKIAYFGTVQDITVKVKAEMALAESARKSKQKKDVILELAKLVGKDFNESLKSITKLAAKTLDVERVSVWKFNEDKSEIACKNLFCSKNRTYQNGSILKYSDNPNYFDALEMNQTIIIDEAQSNNITKGFKNYLIENNIMSLMDVFVTSSDGYYGIICFEHTGETLKSWTADELEFATSIANIVSLMVESNERQLAEEKIERANKKLVAANVELNSLRKQLEQENVYLRNELDLVFNYEEMVYGSAEFSKVLTEVEKVASTTATVLLLGESGTGKELLARAVHNISSRNTKPLIKVNCSAIPRELIESELFGHKKGSFTGAFNDKIGKFELANEGTLFLDEIGELPLDMQPKILRFLQEGEIEVVGGTGTKKLNVRVIAATNRNLKDEVEKKRFREDLYFRLNVFPIEIPPLRERKDDIPLLVEHFVDKFNKAYDKQIKFIPDETMTKLMAYNWPGNIRELENLIERASILSSANTLIIPGFETTTQKTKQKLLKGKDLSLEAVQRTHIIQILEQCKWKISGTNGAANMLGLKPSTLRDKMNKLVIKRPR